MCSDLCQVHRTLDRYWRSAKHGASYICDTNLCGWYCFVGQGSGHLAETCVPCPALQHSHALVAQGHSPVQLWGYREPQGLCSLERDWCLWDAPVQVKTCARRLLCLQPDRAPSCPAKSHIAYRTGERAPPLSSNLRLWRALRVTGVHPCWCLCACDPADPSSVEETCEECSIEDCLSDNGRWSCQCKQHFNGSGEDSGKVIGVEKCQQLGKGHIPVSELRCVWMT